MTFFVLAWVKPRQNMKIVQSSVGSTAYSILVLDLVILLVWSLVWIWTKRAEQGAWTDIHMSLTAVAGTMLLLLVCTWLYQAGRR